MCVPVCKALLFNFESIRRIHVLTRLKDDRSPDASPSALSSAKTCRWPNRESVLWLER